MIYFDNSATTSPKPQSVKNAVLTALSRYSVNPGRGGYKMSLDTSQMIYDVRQKLSDCFNANGAENVIFTKNCTESINIAMQGVISAGDRFIISSLEHNAVYRSAAELECRGAKYDIADVSDDDGQTLHNFERLIFPETKAIICLHASNVTGKILPIEKIGELCKERSLIFIVDAAQTAGVLPIDVQRCNIDCLCIAPHKGMYAPMGTGVLISGALPRPLIFGGTGSNSISQTLPDFTPDKYESGTLNVPGICGIGAGVNFLKSHAGIADRERYIAKYIDSELRKISGVTVYSAADESHVPIVTFNVGDIPSEQTANLLAKKNIAVRAGLHCAPLAHKSIGTLHSGAVRAAPGAFTTAADAKLLIAAVKNIANINR